ncbi:uncharacterized protein [Paramisgurnus dabryanus]|uniref:uncharacterized protein n=1 Tax=Paramisgurnus dabryanus TaxID=90735 RepID=UPI003CCFAE49
MDLLIEGYLDLAVDLSDPPEHVEETRVIPSVYDLIKARVSPITQQNEHDADDMESERKLQKWIKMFQITGTSGGPLDKVTTPQTSSKPSVRTAISRECNWGIDPPSKPQWDFKRANFLPPIRKETKVKAFGKACVTRPAIHQNEHDADEVQEERKQQERIKMFQFTGTSGGPLDKATTSQTSSKPSVSTATPQERNWGFDLPNTPQWDFERVKVLPPISKMTKVEAYGKASVTPAIQQHEHDADEVAIEKFEVKIQDEKTSELSSPELHPQRKWKIFSRLLSKRLRTAIQQHKHDADEVQIGKFEVKIQDEKTSEGEVQEKKAQRK